MWRVFNTYTDDGLPTYKIECTVGTPPVGFESRGVRCSG